MIAIIFNSCSEIYYQVYKAVPKEQIITKDNSLIYEDENCMLVYDLWLDGGNIGFKFYNKSDRNMYLNMEESFFILNDRAFNYYKNRTYTNGNSIGTTKMSSFGSSRISINNSTISPLNINNSSTTFVTGSNNTSIYSETYSEEKVICIPGHTFKVIDGYLISSKIFRDCELFLFPQESQILTKKFDISNSPINFGNRITYSFDKSEKNHLIVNEFYVSEITNYPKNKLVIKKYEDRCNEKSFKEVEYFRETSPDRFYIKYNRATGDLSTH